MTNFVQKIYIRRFIKYIVSRWEKYIFWQALNNAQTFIAMNYLVAGDGEGFSFKRKRKKLFSHLLIS